MIVSRVVYASPWHKLSTSWPVDVNTFTRNGPWKPCKMKMISKVFSTEVKLCTLKLITKIWIRWFNRSYKYKVLFRTIYIKRKLNFESVSFSRSNKGSDHENWHVILRERVWSHRVGLEDTSSMRKRKNLHVAERIGVKWLVTSASEFFDSKSFKKSQEETTVPLLGQKIQVRS